MNWASPYCQPHGVDHSHTGVVSSSSSGLWQCVPTNNGGVGFMGVPVVQRFCLMMEVGQGASNQVL